MASRLAAGLGVESGGEPLRLKTMNQLDTLAPA
jgi:hypothetical protein